MSGKSVQEVSKIEKVKYAKTDARYWKPKLYRNSYTHQGKVVEVADWCIKLAYAGRRETLNLRTSNQAAAASKAASTYRQLLTEGWQAVLDQLRPKAAAEVKAATVGALFTVCRELSSARPESLDTYTKAFRRIVAGIIGAPDNSKFDSHGGGTAEWRAMIEATPLADITPAAVLTWKNAMLRSTTAPKSRPQLIVTVNSLIRNSKALFAKKVLPFIAQRVVLPSPLPFEGITQEKPPSLRYNSKVNAPAILQAAGSELQTSDVEAYKALILCLVLGLRRSEADWLEWEQFDFDRCVLTVRDTEFKRLKSADSAGVIDIEAEIVAILRPLKDGTKSKFVLETPASVRNRKHATRKARSYRCNATFNRLIAWLKAQGVKDKKPIHVMRKEVGSIIASEQGIWAASRYLRHSDIRITSQIYADKKQPVVAGLGKMMGATKPTKEGA